MGIARDDKDARQDWVLRGFRQFDAPVCVIVTYDRSIHGGDIAVRLRRGDERAGQRRLVARPWLRDQQPGHHAIPGGARARRHRRDQVIMICIAMGLPDDSFPANAVVSERKSVDEAAVFVGFEK